MGGPFIVLHTVSSILLEVGCLGLDWLGWVSTVAILACREAGSGYSSVFGSAGVGRKEAIIS
jgi:hypothetical protein